MVAGAFSLRMEPHGRVTSLDLEVCVIGFRDRFGPKESPVARDWVQHSSHHWCCMCNHWLCIPKRSSSSSQCFRGSGQSNWRVPGHHLCYGTRGESPWWWNSALSPGDPWWRTHIHLPFVGLRTIICLLFPTVNTAGKVRTRLPRAAIISSQRLRMWERAPSCWIMEKPACHGWNSDHIWFS